MILLGEVPTCKQGEGRERAGYGYVTTHPKTLFSLGRIILQPSQIFSASIFSKCPLKFAVVSLEF